MTDGFPIENPTWDERGRDKFEEFDLTDGQREEARRLMHNVPVGELPPEIQDQIDLDRDEDYDPREVFATWVKKNFEG